MHDINHIFLCDTCTVYTVTQHFKHQTWQIYFHHIFCISNYKDKMSEIDALNKLLSILMIVYLLQNTGFLLSCLTRDNQAYQPVDRLFFNIDFKISNEFSYRENLGFKLICLQTETDILAVRQILFSDQQLELNWLCLRI